MQSPWDSLGNGTVPHLAEFDGDLSKIASRKGYLDATCLGYLSQNMGTCSAAHKNCITFSMRTVTFQGTQPNRANLHSGDKQVNIPKGENCAEYKVYNDLLPALAVGHHLMIDQSKAPCRGCLNKMQGLARAKQINIVVHYVGSYDLLNTNNGTVFISNTGIITWQK